MPDATQTRRVTVHDLLTELSAAALVIGVARFREQALGRTLAQRRCAASSSTAVFADLDDAQAAIDVWMHGYNHARAHQGIGDEAPTRVPDPADDRRRREREDRGGRGSSVGRWRTLERRRPPTGSDEAPVSPASVTCGPSGGRARGPEGSASMAEVIAPDRARVAQGAAPPRAPELDQALEQHRVELTGYCYRMLGSAFEAEDAVQETLVRAWRGFERFEGRAALRSWLYRIATNVCLDMLRGRQRRAMPMDLVSASVGDVSPGPRLPESRWVQPIPDGRAVPDSDDPAELAVSRETIRVAFVAALQHLPARQRAVLILRDVLRWQAAEVAELLDTTVVSVNSALQRARATLAVADLTATEPWKPTDDEQRALVSRYVDAFERFDIEALVALLHEDATMSMPPYPLWLHGAAELDRWLRGAGSGCRGSRFVATVANGSPAFAQWRDGGDEPWAIHVLGISGGRIAAIDFFVDPNLFPLFGQPLRLED